jgi:hypothetical protein
MYVFIYLFVPCPQKRGGHGIKCVALSVADVSLSVFDEYAYLKGDIEECLYSVVYEVRSFDCTSTSTFLSRVRTHDLKHPVFLEYFKHVRNKEGRSAFQIGAIVKARQVKTFHCTPASSLYTWSLQLAFVLYTVFNIHLQARMLSSWRPQTIC